MDLKLSTATGDVEIVEGEASLARGIDAIRQHLQIRLQTFRGEWFLDQREGIPFVQDVFKKNPDQAVLNAVFTNVILETPGVLSLNSLSFDLANDRTLTISFSATTAFGDLDFSTIMGA